MAAELWATLNAKDDRAPAVPSPCTRWSASNCSRGVQDRAKDLCAVASTSSP
ncbi:MAG: hypothetical protein MZW92_43830 [Comamonadaceae bacterium]|nr:hypothetical protein [Comamonadaceae bacterium]